MSDYQSHVLLLASGGIDSTILGFKAINEKSLRSVCFVDYGQPAASGERRAVTLYAEKNWHVPIHEVTVRGIHVAAMMGVGTSGPRVVPARNMVLVSIAANIATMCDCNEVWFGAIGDDVHDYWDCRRGFIEAIDVAARVGARITARAPFFGEQKRDLVVVARASGIDLSSTWSCYQPISTDKPCLSCNSCRQKAEALGVEHGPRERLIGTMPDFSAT